MHRYLKMNGLLYSTTIAIETAIVLQFNLIDFNVTTKKKQLTINDSSIETES